MRPRRSWPSLSPARPRPRCATAFLRRCRRRAPGSRWRALPRQCCGRRTRVTRPAAGTSSETRHACALKPSMRSITGWQRNCRSPPDQARVLRSRAPPRRCIGARRVPGRSWRRLEQRLADMLERRSHWLPRLLQARGSGLAQRVQDSLESALRAELAPAIATLPAALLREGEALLTHVQRVRAAAAAAAGAPPAAPAGAVLLDAEPASLPHWRALCELALTEQGWRRRFTTREGFERNDKAMKIRVGAWIEALERLPDAQNVCRVVRGLPDPWIDAADHQALEALAVLLVRAAAELQLVFAATARVDYSYVAAAAREALSEQGAPSDFALRAGGALRHILVDEFQDTSYEQFALLRALTAGWERGDGRTLFVVGDPMQSIYRFREAEVGLFLRARDHGLGDIRFRALQLRRNFRSGAPLIAWVNANFSRLFPPDDDARRAAI